MSNENFEKGYKLIHSIPPAITILQFFAFIELFALIIVHRYYLNYI